MSEASHVGNAHGTAETGKLSKKNPKMMWYIFGGLAVVAVLVFFFVRKSSTAAGATAASAGTVAGYGATANNSLIDSLLSSGLLNTGSGGNAYSNGLTGPAGAVGAKGATGPAGAAGAAGAAAPTVPVQKSPGASNLMAITGQEASTLLSKTQRPFQWNGTAYVPATSIVAGQQYYAGPLEWKEILTGTGPFATPGSTTKTPPRPLNPPPVVTHK
jgi:hypothetical protein